jgi:hypothetical protein
VSKTKKVRSLATISLLRSPHKEVYAECEPMTGLIETYYENDLKRVSFTDMHITIDLKDGQTIRIWYA